MGTAQRTRLFENIVRLRRAERELPGAGLDLVRDDLESELGPTVSRHLAAQLLGVSHTALNRWIDAGDVPVVVTPEGRRQVPVAALIELYERVDAERKAGRRRLHALEPVMLEARERAERLRPEAVLEGEPGEVDRHRISELRSLAYHRAVAERLRRPMVDEARRRVRRWVATGRIDPRHAAAWEDVLRRPIAEIRELISADTPSARDLRQSSPLAGLLSEPERRKILEKVR